MGDVIREHPFVMRELHATLGRPVSLLALLQVYFLYTSKAQKSRGIHIINSRVLPCLVQTPTYLVIACSRGWSFGKHCGIYIYMYVTMTLDKSKKKKLMFNLGNEVHLMI